ncbi:MAG: hypothetical protein GQ570_03850 [Helicobacteraceae bacterium]|nr:hypothetical protein [Helicobacteraceae bacterium]
MTELMSKAKGVTHVVTAADVTATEVVFRAQDMKPNGYMVVVRDAAGAAKAWDGAVTIADGLITVDNSGATDFAATDVISLLAW